MSIENWVTIISVLVLIVGWFINGYLNRSHEIANQRRKYRMEMLEDYLKIFFHVQKSSGINPFDDPAFLPLIESTRTKFLLYGKKNEVETYENMIKCIEDKNVNAWNKSLNELIQLVRKQIRRELKI